MAIDEELDTDIEMVVSNLLLQYETSLVEMIEVNLQSAIEQGIDGVTRKEALDIARRETAKLVTNIIEQTREVLQQVVKNGLEEQIGIPKLAKRIQDHIGLTVPQSEALDNLYLKLMEEGIYDPSEIADILELEKIKKIKQRSEVIARTEARNNIEGAENEVAKEGGATHKMSLSVGDERVSDICRTCEAQGIILIEQAFSSGSDYPPHHPMCRCTTSYITA